MSQLAAIVAALTPHADCRPGLAGMILVDGVPMLRVSGSSVVLLALPLGTERLDARTVGRREPLAAVAREVLDRRAALRAWQKAA